MKVLESAERHRHSEQHPLAISVFLHLFPGAVMIAGFVLVAPLFIARGLPSLLALIVIDAFFVQPQMGGMSC